VAVSGAAVIVGAYALTAATTARALLYCSRRGTEVWDLAAGPGWLAGLLVVTVALIERLAWAAPATVATSFGLHTVGLLTVACLTVWTVEDTLIARPDAVGALEERLPDWFLRAVGS
jgi:hypothetical protein